MKTIHRLCECGCGKKIVARGQHSQRKYYSKLCLKKHAKQRSLAWSKKNKRYHKKNHDQALFRAQKEENDPQEINAFVFYQAMRKAN